MSFIGRPKRQGEEFARTRHVDPEHDGPSSTKKPRFDLRNPSALAPDALEEDAILDADEIGRRGQRVRRNAVNIDGYDSDSENEGFDARVEAKAQKDKQAGAGDDDMFADLEEDFGEGSPTVEKKKQVRFLNDEEIEGQVGDSRSGGRVKIDGINGREKGKKKEGEGDSESDTDEEGRAELVDVDEELGAGGKKEHAPLLDAFNMRAEQEDGRFDDTGNYVRKAVDPDAVHDSWLEGVSRKDIRKAKEAAAKRDEERRQKAIADDKILAGDVLKTLILHLERGETILEALARLGKGLKQRPKWQINKNRNKLKKKNGESEDVEMGEDDPAETARKRAIEEITEAADVLLSRGQPEIYDAERELLMRQYKRETGDDWVDPKEDAPDTNAVTRNSMWEFRWADARDGGGTHGPYDRPTMEQWNSAGYFGEGVEFRRVDGSGEWLRTTDFA